jgi:hypothetical protein
VVVRAQWFFPVLEASVLGPEVREAFTGDVSSAPEAPRLDLIRRVRREIAAGTYDTPERWEAALANLAQRLF